MKNRTPEASPIPPLSRRSFVKLSTAAGLLLGVQLPGCTPVTDASDELPGATDLRDALDPTAAPFAPNAFVRISSDNLVSVVVKFQEMGQGTATGVATLVAEELDADWDLVRVEYAPANPRLYNNTAFGPVQLTGGSTAMRGCYQQMRTAGAAARAMLVQAAAAAWSVPASELVVEKSVITHGSGKRATFGELATRAAAQPLPTNPPLKATSKFGLIGKDKLRRVDTLAKSTGTAVYTIDVKLPGLLTAVIARPPTLSATLVSFDAKDALQVRGVTDVVQVPEGVAVVAQGMWQAIKGQRALKIVWDTSADAALDTEKIFADYRALAEKPGASVIKSEQTEPQLATAEKTIEAVYEFPYLAHAPMEPLNCVAWLHDGQLETWSGHQFQTFDHQNAATTSGLPPDKVQIHTLMAGGSFGRRSTPWSDFTVEAVNVAKAIKGRAPVRVQRTREDDMGTAQFRPQYVHRARVGVTADGKIAGWKHTVVGQAIYNSAPGLGRNPSSIDMSSVEGLWPTPYAIPNMTVDVHSPTQVVRTLWWRSVGHSHTAFAIETMMDEAAVAAGADPLAFRLALLTNKPRHTAVLKLAAEKAGWGGPVPSGRGRGIVLHESFSSYVAMVAEVSARADGTPKVERVVVAVDVGVAINPDIVRSQIEGGLGFGLSAALYGEITIKEGAVQETNFGGYRVLRMEDMPAVEVHIVASDAAPTGVGEIGVPPIGPAVANAFFALTGKRVRRLPFQRLAENG
jgi:isoquinoline 1-oxidoreductase subunit beta